MIHVRYNEHVNTITRITRITRTCTHTHIISVVTVEKCALLHLPTWQSTISPWSDTIISWGERVEEHNSSKRDRAVEWQWDWARENGQRVRWPEERTIRCVLSNNKYKWNDWRNWCDESAFIAPEQFSLHRIATTHIHHRYKSMHNYNDYYYCHRWCRSQRFYDTCTKSCIYRPMNVLVCLFIRLFLLFFVFLHFLFISFVLFVSNPPFDPVIGVLKWWNLRCIWHDSQADIDQNRLRIKNNSLLDIVLIAKISTNRVKQNKRQQQLQRQQQQ